MEIPGTPSDLPDLCCTSSLLYLGYAGHNSVGNYKNERVVRKADGIFSRELCKINLLG